MSDIILMIMFPQIYIPVHVNMVYFLHLQNSYIVINSTLENTVPNFYPLT